MISLPPLIKFCGQNFCISLQTTNHQMTTLISMPTYLTTHLAFKNYSCTSLTLHSTSCRAFIGCLHRLVPSPSILSFQMIHLLNHLSEYLKLSTHPNYIVTHLSSAPKTRLFQRIANINTSICIPPFYFASTILQVIDYALVPTTPFCT